MYAIGPGRYRATSAIRSSNSVGFTWRRASRMPDDSNWNTPGVAAGHHLGGLSVVERQRVHVEAHARGLLDHLDGAVDHVEVAQAQEVHLEQPERLDVAHRELGHDLGVGALLLQRQVLG